MKTLLISPYSDISSMGLRSISASLRKAGHQTRMIFLPYPYPETAVTVDFQHRYTKKIMDQIADLTSDVGLIGMSLMTNYVSMVRDLTRFLQERTSVPIIWGGIHPSTRPAECLDIVDMVCISEGEAPMVELADRLSRGEAYDDIPNIWLKHNGNLINNPPRPLLKDLDTLPHFDYDFEDQYVLDRETEQLLPLDKELFRIFMTREKPTKARAALFYQTIASRGCPYSCTFCCQSAIKRLYNIPSTIRRRSNRHIIDELRWVRKELPFIQEITFSDDSFFAVSTAVAKEFRDMYKAEVGLPFQCLAEPRTITRDKMDLFVDAGMINIQIGIQTGSERVKKFYGRTDSNEVIVAMTELLHEYIPRIRPPIFDFILDNPWETIEDSIATFKLLLQMRRPYYLQLFSLVFFPEIAIFDKAMEDGLIKDVQREIYDQQYNTRRITYVNVLFSLFSRRVPLPVLRFLSTPSLVRAMDKPWISYLLGKAHTVFTRLRLLPLIVKHKLLPKPRA